MAFRERFRRDYENFAELLTHRQSDTIFHIFDPDIAQQVTVQTPLPKYSALRDFMIHLAGPGDIVSSNGEHWKKWRSIMVSSMEIQSYGRPSSLS